MWSGCHDLEEVLPCFEGISVDIIKSFVDIKLGNVEVEVNPREWNGYVQTQEIFSTKDETSKPPWNDRLTSFQKLILIKCFKEEKVVFGIIAFVSMHLGAQFVESPPVQLSTLYEDTSNTIPLVFVLSPGSDPMSSFLRFAKEMSYMER